MAQTVCPVMGGNIDKSLYFDHKGKRIYYCCSSCLPELKKNPAKYIEKLETQGVTLAKAAVLCTKCGEGKGTPECCKPEGRTECASCGRFKGSPGCCKTL